jgi:hypothetical protein
MVMKREHVLLLAVLFLLCANGTAIAGTQDDAVIALHVRDLPAKAQLCTPDTLGFGTSPTVPCDQYVVEETPGNSNLIYVVVANAGSADGVAGLSLGIDYPTGVGTGITVVSWSLCADIEIPNSGWPAPGGGNVIAWNPVLNCQDTEVGNFGVHAVVGGFYTYAYDASVFKITRNENLQSGPEFKVADCAGSESNLVYPGGAGRVGIDAVPDPVHGGYRPCFPGLGRPVIKSVHDVVGDQGRQVRVQFDAAVNDVPEAFPGVTSYTLFRHVPDALIPATANPLSLPPGTWDMVGSVPAGGDPSYSVVVPTLCDSTILEGQCLSTFVVRAQTTVLGRVFDSAPDTGYSVDNLAPASPFNLLFAAPGVLSWDEAEEEDFAWYTVYGSASATFDGSAVAIYTTTETAQNLKDDWKLGGVPPYEYYHVTASDYSGNEGPASTALNTVGVGGPGLPQVFAMRQNRPNPFEAATLIQLDLPSADKVRLEIFDVRGRRVKTLVDGVLDAGEHPLTWSGHDDSGRIVPPGVYFYRVHAGAFRETRKAIRVR